MSFTEKTPTEEDFFGFDFARDLQNRSAGVTIQSAEWFVTVIEGTDPNPSAMLSGAPVISGSKVSHLIVGGVVDVHYCLKCRAHFSDTSDPELYDDLWVRNPCS